MALISETVKAINDIPMSDTDKEAVSKALTNTITYLKEKDLESFVRAKYIAVVLLGLVVLITIISTIVFVSINKVFNTPVALLSLGSASLGAIVGLLSPLIKK